MNSSTKSQYLDILQIFRGLAALMVVLHHSIGSLKHYHNIQYPILDYIAYLGKFGVDFFFVLSGFIITYSAHYKYNEPNSFSNYIKNRLIRIYVPYLPIGIFMLFIYTFLPSFSNGDRAISIFTSLTLIPHGNPALSVAWTLSFELLFYLLFSISFLSKRAWNWFVLFWFLAIIVYTYSSFSSFPFFKMSIFRLLFSTYNIEFILGYFLAIAIIKKLKINLFLGFFILVGIICIFTYSLIEHPNFFRFDINLLFALGTFLINYIAIYYFNFKIKSTAILMLVGNATYSIYLIHNPLQMIVIRMYPKITSTAGVVIALVVVLILSSIVGYLYYLIFEKKLMNLIKSKLAN